MKKKLILSMVLSVSTVVSMTVTPLVAKETKYEPGVTVEQNTNPDWDADYMATFVYEDSDARDAISVNIQGGFQFYKEDEVKDYDASGDNSQIPCYDAYNYEDGMFAASSNLKTGTMIPYEMEEVSDEVFQVTIPLPANQYFYAYYITYSDGSIVEKAYDPANLPEKNIDSDAGWSLFYVGSGETKGQEYIYPRSNQNGKVEYITYSAVDGTKQPLGVYLPYNYDASKTYKTIYVSHGGGGNEVEWMTIGSIPNIMDNLIANNEAAQAIVVTMDNTYFNWDYSKIVPNVVDHIIPTIESRYSVSKNADDRAFCGLSMGSMTTNEMLKQVPEEFGYYGAFSGGNSDLDPANWNSEAMNSATIYLTAGCIDMAYNNNLGISSVDYMKMLDQMGVNYTFDLKPGSHDWYVWRDSFTTFTKDYLWDYEDVTTPEYQPGVTVEENKDTNYDGDYLVTFAYQDQDTRDATKVTVSGNMQFYQNDEVAKNFITTGDASGAKVYDAYHYQDGMFNTGYGLNNDTVVYEMEETADEYFEVSLPLPGNLYYYDYTITYEDGSEVTIQDPVNPAVDNPTNGHDANHSLVYVGNSENTTEGQEYIYARNDQQGSYLFVSYEANDGTMQPLGVYLPYNYDANKTYKTIYVSHGGGGNENEWMTIGALPNIMDNLIANNEAVGAVVVTMDNTYFNWDYEKIADNMKNNIIPYIEANYSVSANVSDRALCGLSMGSMTTSTIMQEYPEMFGYYGCFSGANVNAEISDVAKLKEATIYLTAGNVDMALKEAGSDDSRKTVGMAAKLDKLDVAYSMDTKKGAHDWGVWRDAYTTFVKDYLWDVEVKDEQPEAIPDENPTQTPTVNNQNNKPVSSVKTGDDQNIMLYGLGLLTGITGLGYGYKKRKMSKKVM
ncbi:MAG: alpha/beta hydrolase [Thomasclavelia sp.]